MQPGFLGCPGGVAVLSVLGDLFGDARAFGLQRRIPQIPWPGGAGIVNTRVFTKSRLRVRVFFCKVRIHVLIRVFSFRHLKPTAENHRMLRIGQL